MKQLTHLVAQIRSLENLIIGISCPLISFQDASDFTNVVMLHKDILLRFGLLGDFRSFDDPVSELVPNLRLDDLDITYNGNWNSSPKGVYMSRRCYGIWQGVRSFRVSYSRITFGRAK